MLLKMPDLVMTLTDASRQYQQLQFETMAEMHSWTGAGQDALMLSC